ncbi:MAG: DNA polymerase III subunit beta [Chloroflexi bacterium]|nr:DNA polymerase III subunit beta [Chloroflexota bacterium]
MRLSCLQENLSRGLALVSRAVATRTTLPITQNVLMETDQSRLKLSATNLELAVTTWVGAKVDQEGAITIPARLLTDFINSLPSERVDMELTPRPLGIHFQCARFEAHINGVDAQEFPPIPTVEEGETIRIDPQVLRTAINRVVFAAATEETRPVLTGVKVEISGQQFTLAGADGFRLAVYKGPLLDPAPEKAEAIVPARTLKELERLLVDQDEPVELVITPSKSQLLVHLKGVEIVSQLIQGTFPNYAQLVPQSFGTRAVVDLQEFSRAARAASIFARDGGGIIRLQMVPGADGVAGKMIVTSRAEETGDNQGEIDAKIDGGEAKIAFSSRYLTEVLSVMEKGEVALETTTPSSPGVVRPVGNEDYVHVVMPMFVQW